MSSKIIINCVTGKTLRVDLTQKDLEDIDAKEISHSQELNEKSNKKSKKNKFLDSLGADEREGFEEIIRDGNID